MPALTNKKLYQALLELDVIPADKLEHAFQVATKNKTNFQHYLLEKDMLTDSQIGQVVAEMYSCHYVTLKDFSIDPEILHLVPAAVAKQQQIISYKHDTAGLHIAMADPENLQIVAFLGKKYGVPIIRHYATPRDILHATRLYSPDIGASLKQVISEYVDREKQSRSKKQEPPIIELVNTLFLHAYEHSVSDIHIESQKHLTVIRFRIDGILHDVAKIPSTLHDRIVSRIKVLAKIRTDEHMAALDGKILLPLSELSVSNQPANSQLIDTQLDIRVSIVPVTSGEKVVLRLLSEGNKIYSISTIGLSEAHEALVEQAKSKPYGMILTCGPTGSGKTTTLYSLLKTLNQRSVNIMTIEDPVEYDMTGVNQIQVQDQTGVSFASGLRAIVRQDPDIILVGEIRDKETAKIAVNAAMTGHLVLSSLHTNDAATAIPRLFDFGVEPFVIASSVTLIIAQRLLRQICPQCRVSQQYTSAELKSTYGKHITDTLLGGKKQIQLYAGKGCSLCHNTGYHGRVGVFELLSLDETIYQAIQQKSAATQIAALAKKAGMTSLFEDGLRKVVQGITTIDEAIRVLQV